MIDGKLLSEVDNEIIIATALFASLTVVLWFS